MLRNRKLQPHDLHILCACTGFGVPMIRVASWEESFLRYEGAEYRCPNCSRGRRAFLVKHPVFGERIRFRRF